MPGILRFTDADGAVRIGLRDDDDLVRPFPAVESMAHLLRLPAADLRELVDGAATGPVVHRYADITVLPPVDGGTEIWASGVTYERSREARVEESGAQAIYDRVYEADRPELFFKSQAWRVVTSREPVAVRTDSELNVPEPELALVVNASGEIVGYTVCNDVSSRSIEGENALYLPQAKVYAGSCALGSEITPVWQVEDLDNEQVEMSVDRSGERIFSGRVALSTMRRKPAELVDYLYRSQPFPDGAVLATGTGIVPDMAFNLQHGDTVNITVSGVGQLSNPVVSGQDGLQWLVRARENPAERVRG